VGCGIPARGGGGNLALWCGSGISISPSTVLSEFGLAIKEKQAEK